MPQLIYRKSAASPWVKQGDRLVKTFPSGLCLIQQTYIAPKSLATYNAFQEGDAITDSQPCIDGAYIFPAPDYQDTGDGFMRCTVTAYGRVNSTGNKTFSKELGVQGFYAYFTPVDGSASEQQAFSVDVTADKLIWKFVTLKTASPNVSISDSLKVYRLSGEDLETVQISEFFSTAYLAGLNKPTEVTFSTPKQIVLAEAVNYGKFDEWTVAWKANTSSISLGSWQRTSAPSKPSSYNPIYSFAAPGPNVWPGQVQWNDVSRNGSYAISLVGIKNINSPSGSWNSSTPSKPIPTTNTPTATYLGGSAKINGEQFFYTPPEFSGPAPVQVRNSNVPPAPAVFQTGAFKYNRVLADVVSNSEGTTYHYKWVLEEILEVFEVTVKNENNQQSNYSIIIRFANFENA
jgi:hypothetical protein